MLRKYCRAYYLKDLRQFNGWAEKREEGEPELTDTDVVYLWDDFSVVRSPIFPDKGLLFDMVTPEWKDYCVTTLQFAIPEDLRYAYEPAEESESDTTQRATAV